MIVYIQYFFCKFSVNIILMRAMKYRYSVRATAFYYQSNQYKMFCKLHYFPSKVAGSIGDCGKGKILVPCFLTYFIGILGLLRDFPLPSLILSSK